MSGFSFTHGTRFMLDGHEYTVRKEDHESVEVLNITYQKVENHTVTQLWDAWSSERLVFKPKALGDEVVLPGSILDFNLVAPDLRDETLNRYRIIEPFVTGRKKPKELSEYLSRLPTQISKTTFYDWKRIWERYHDIRYLAPQRNKRGPNGSRTDDETMKLIEDVIRPVYQGEKRADEALYDEYCARVDEENQFGKNLPVISVSTFKRRKREILNVHSINTIKMGRHLADLTENGSTREFYVDRPLARVEVDSTVADVLLINPATGKPEHPYILLAWDKCTDGPLGFDVDFGAPDTASLKRCLLHVMCPKGYVRNMYPLVQGEWALFGKPRLLVLDNAKINESQEFEEVCRLLNIEVMYTKVGAGNQKGSVERAFRSLNDKLIHGLPGTTFSNPVERGRYESEAKACISKQQFIYMLHIALIDLIVNDWNTSIESTPHQRWIERWAAYKHLRPELPRSKEELMFLLMTNHDKRTISNKGIVIDNQHYNSPELMRLRNSMRDLGKKDFEVKVRFNSSDMRLVYVYDEYGDRFIKAHQTGMARKGISTDYPVPRTDVLTHALLVSKQRNSVARKPRAIARRNIGRLVKIEQQNQRRGILPSDDIPGILDYYGISILGNALARPVNGDSHTGMVTNVEGETRRQAHRSTSPKESPPTLEDETIPTARDSYEISEGDFEDWVVSRKSNQRGVYDVRKKSV